MLRGRLYQTRAIFGESMLRGLFTLPEEDLPRVAKASASGHLDVLAFSRDSGTMIMPPLSFACIMTWLR